MNEIQLTQAMTLDSTSTDPIAAKFTVAANEDLRGKILTHTGKTAAWITPDFPPGTVTKIDIAPPEPFVATSDSITSQGKLSFDSKELPAGLFYGTPATEAGKLTPRPITSDDLPIVGVSHGGTGNSQPLSNGRVMISKGGKIVEGPEGMGVLMQGPNGLTLGKIEFEKHIAGEIPKFTGSSVPSPNGKPDQVLTTNGSGVQEWRPLSKGVETHAPRITRSDDGLQYDLSINMVDGDCVEFDFVEIYLSPYERINGDVTITLNSQVEIFPYSLPADDEPEAVHSSVKLFRSLDKLILKVHRRDRVTFQLTDFSKPVVVSIRVVTTTPGASITPLLAKIIQY